MLEELGQENVKLSPQQMRDVVRVLKEEAGIVSEEKLKLKEEKEYMKRLEEESRQRDEDEQREKEELLKDDVKQ